MAPEGWVPFEVLDTDVDDNAARLAKFVKEGDLVVAAGGDGTATIATNGILLSGISARLGVLGYGNFNDMARAFGVGSLAQILSGATRVEKVWPIECFIDGRHWRYAVGYFTIGMFAEACEVFDHEKHRKKLQTGRKGLVFSWRILVEWWIRSRKRRFLPRFTVNGRSVVKNTTDYVAMNGPKMAKMMRGRRWYRRRREFWSETAKLSGFFRLLILMSRSLLFKVPGKETEGDLLEFSRPANIEIQGEGEYKKLEGVRRVEVRKAEKYIEIVSIKS